MGIVCVCVCVCVKGSGGLLIGRGIPVPPLYETLQSVCLSIRVYVCAYASECWLGKVMITDIKLVPTLLGQ